MSVASKYSMLLRCSRANFLPRHLLNRPTVSGVVRMNTDRNPSAIRVPHSSNMESTHHTSMSPPGIPASATTPTAVAMMMRTDQPVRCHRDFLVLIIGYANRPAPTVQGIYNYPDLEDRLREEAKVASRDPVALASFEALRLNKGTSDTVEAHLLQSGTWKAAEGEAAAVGDYILGIDLGATEAMSAACGFWPESGRLDGVACFGSEPGPKERGLRDGVGAAYQKMEARGELVLSPGRISDVTTLLGEVWERWGKPKAIVSDRWRTAELRKALAQLDWPVVSLVERGQGYKDGSEDVRGFKAAFLRGLVVPTRSLLLSSAVANARTVSDAAGNTKLAKSAQGGRHSRSRDDAAAAAILAVALGWRKALQGNGNGNGTEPGVRSMVV